MKILEKGNPVTWTKEVICTGKGNDDGPGCKSKLEINKDDLFRTSRQSYGDTYPEYFCTFKCPVCGALTDIPWKQIPNFIASNNIPMRDEWLAKNEKPEVPGSLGFN